MTPPTKQQSAGAALEAALSEWHLTHVHPSELPYNDGNNCTFCDKLRPILARLLDSFAREARLEEAKESPHEYECDVVHRRGLPCNCAKGRRIAELEKGVQP